MSDKLTTKEIFGIRLRDLRKQNGYTIEQFAAKIGVAKSTIGYYENENRMPDVEILSRIYDVFNVPADYLLGRTNTAAAKGKMKTVCELTGLSDTAADFLSQLLKHRRYVILDKLNYLLEDFANDCNENYDMQGNKNLEDTSSILNPFIRGFFQERFFLGLHQYLIKRTIDTLRFGYNRKNAIRLTVMCHASYHS